MGRTAKIISALVLVPILALLALELRLRTVVDKVWEVPPGSEKAVLRVLCVGDSITHGGKDALSYPYHLAQVMKDRGFERVVVWNMGLPGAETSEILQQLPEWLKQFRPHLVVSMIGASDNRAGRVGGANVSEFRVFRLWEAARKEWRAPNAGEIEAFLKNGDDSLNYYQNVLWNFNHDIYASIPFHEKMLNLHPGHGFARLSLGRIKILQNDFSGAEILLVAARKLGEERGNDPLVGVAENYLYDLFDRQGREKEVRELLVARIAQTPTEPWAWEMLVGRYRRQGDLPEAERVAREGIEKARLNDRLRRYLVRVLREQGRMADAEKVEAEIPLGVANRAAYLDLREKVEKAGAELFAMQYPTLSVTQLQENLGPESSLFRYVSNENFKELVTQKTFDWYFNDDHGGTYGHLTRMGAAAMAQNVAAHIFNDPELRKILDGK